MCRCRLHRRTFLGIIAAAPLLAACKPQKEGPEDIRWGRETCAICGMIISDPRYAAEIRGGPDRTLVKFDDIGDAVHWLSVQDWADSPDEFWVRDSNTGEDWLDARRAFYHPDTISPMDYGYAAVPTQEPGAVTFEQMKAGVMAKGLSSRCLPIEEWKTE
jgi:copper chaperone NosL